MKHLNHNRTNSIGLAARASIALLAVFSSAHAQQSKTHIVELKTGYDSNNQDTLSIGDSDPNIRTHVLGNGGGFTPNLVYIPDFDSAELGSQAFRIDTNAGWNSVPLIDNEAHWVHSHSQSNADVNVLYAHAFELPLDMPDDASVTLEIDYRVDNMLAGLYLRHASATGASPTQITGAPSGSWNNLSSFSVTMDASDLGLKAGSNTLFVHQHSASSGYFAGLQYSATVTATWCEYKRELRSGMMYDDNAGWLSLFQGAVDQNVRTVTLPDPYTAADLSAAFATLSPPTGGANAATLAHPGGASLSQASGWIFGGTNTLSNLFAIDFNLPAAMPSSSSLPVTLSLEWLADDILTEVYLNSESNPLGITGGSWSSATSQTLTSTISGLGLQPGRNTLYLLQDDTLNGFSGVNYIANLTIHNVPCEGFPETDYSTFCVCDSDWGPCNNPGQAEQGCANSTTLGSRLSATGAGNNITLHADNLPTPQTIGLFFRGTAQIGPFPFGDGLRCVGGEVNRIKVLMTDTGSASHGPVSSGALYQFWYRDPAGPCGFGFNLSSAIAIP